MMQVKIFITTVILHQEVCRLSSKTRQDRMQSDGHSSLQLEYWFSVIGTSKHKKNKLDLMTLVCCLCCIGLSRHILFHVPVTLNNSSKTFHNFDHCDLNRFVFPGSMFIYIFVLVIVRALLALGRTYHIIIINDRYSYVIGQVGAYRDLCPWAVANDAPPIVGF